MDNRFRDLYQEIFTKNQLDAYINEENIEKFSMLTELMLETNAVMNITAITEIEKIIPLHYADCVKISDLIPKNAVVADIGCGGGFPILPLAIVRPDLKLIGIDSTEKKAKYVQETAKKMGLNIKTIAGRAEDLAKTQELRQKFDVVVSRAVAQLNVLDELCMPFVKQNGCFIAMKGATGAQELKEASLGIQKLGGMLEKEVEYELFTHTESEQRTLFVIKQNEIIQSTYPRQYANIKKKPL